MRRDVVLVVAFVSRRGRLHSTSAVSVRQIRASRVPRRARRRAAGHRRRARRCRVAGGRRCPTGEFLSYNPLHGSSIPQKTTVWITYDADYLYFAFKCDDPDPSGIKTSVTRRDNIWQDDWVGLSLDALGTGQLSYHLMVNASGVQLDMLNSVAGNEDPSPDWIWDSAEPLTDTGFTAEIRLPLQSIRFKGGDDTRMGVLFWRRVSRARRVGVVAAARARRWVFERHASLRFDRHRAAPRARDCCRARPTAAPTLRDSPTRWGAADGRSDVGVSTKVGLTSTITLDATVNPDFSQVESDAFQVEVNQRFPVFFGEKRPFFMEGAGIFALAGGGSGDNSAAHRRAHAPHRRSDLRRQADRQHRARDLRHALGRRRSGRRQSPLQHRPRAVQPRPQQLRRRALHRRRRRTARTIVSPAPTCAWRVNETQRLDAFVLASQLARVGRERRHDQRRRRAGELQLLDAHLGRGRASFEHYDDDFQHGHGVHEPRRRDRRLGVRRAQLLSGQDQAPLAPPLHGLQFHAGRATTSSPAAANS